MKESEAKTKSCPKLEQGCLSGILSGKEDVNLTVDEWNAIDGLSKCKGSGCVMWEQYTTEEHKEIKEELDDDGVILPDGWQYVRKAQRGKILVVKVTATDSGDCGMKPSCNAYECQM